MLNSDGLIPPSIDLDTISDINEQFRVLKDSYDAIIKEYAIVMDDLVDYSIQRYKNIYNRLVETYKKKIVSILSYIEEQEFNLSEIKFSIFTGSWQSMYAASMTCFLRRPPISR